MYVPFVSFCPSEILFSSEVSTECIERGSEGGKFLFASGIDKAIVWLSQRLQDTEVPNMQNTIRGRDDQKISYKVLAFHFPQFVIYVEI